MNKIDTQERVLPNSRRNASLKPVNGRPGTAPVALWKSIAHAQMDDIYIPRTRPTHGVRTQIQTEILRKEAEDFVSSLKPKVEEFTVGSETRSQFIPYDENAYTMAPTLAKTRSSATKTYSFGMSGVLNAAFPQKGPSKEPTMAQTHNVSVPTETIKNTNYVDDVPVTVHSSRLAGLGTKRGTQENRNIPFYGSTSAATELGVQVLVKKVLRRMQEKGVSIDTFMDRCIDFGIQCAIEEASYEMAGSDLQCFAREARKDAERFGPGGANLGGDPGDMVVLSKAVREAVYSLKIDIGQADLQKLLHCCDFTKTTETVSLATLRYFLYRYS